MSEQLKRLASENAQLQQRLEASSASAANALPRSLDTFGHAHYKEARACEKFGRAMALASSCLHFPVRRQCFANLCQVFYQALELEEKPADGGSEEAETPKQAAFGVPVIHWVIQTDRNCMRTRTRAWASGLPETLFRFLILSTS